MLKTISQLEHKIEDKLYHFTCDCDAPLPHVKESIIQFLGYIYKVEDAVKQQQEAQKEAEAKAKAEGEQKVEEPQTA